MVKIGIFSRNRAIDKVVETTQKELYENPPREVLDLHREAAKARQSLESLTEQLAPQLLSEEEIAWVSESSECLVNCLRERLESGFSNYHAEIYGYENDWSNQELWYILSEFQKGVFRSEMAASEKLETFVNHIKKDAVSRVDAALPEVVQEEKIELVLNTIMPYHIGSEMIDVSSLVVDRVCL